MQQKAVETSLRKFDKKYLILSGKGGVGKTTVAVNLAWLKAKEGHKVGLLDIDLHGPDLAHAMYLEDRRLSVDENGRLIPAQAAENLWVMTVQHLLGRRQEAVMWRGPRKIRAIIQFISETAWPELDYLFIDSPPGTGDETLTVLRNIPDVKALVVSTGQSMSISDVAKALDCLKTCQTETFGLVENLSSLICPECGAKTPLYGLGGCQKLASEAGISYLTDLPMDPAASLLADQKKTPLVEAAPDSPLTLKLIELAAKL